MMRIKTYTSESVPEALRMIKEELGPGAVILKTNRKVAKKFWGLLPTMAYEITAATDGTTGSEPELREAATQIVDGNGEQTELGRRAPLNGVDAYEVAESPPPLPSNGDQNRSNAVGGLEVAPPVFGQWSRELHRLSDEIQNLVRMVNHQQAHDAISSLFLGDSDIARGLQQLIWKGEIQDPELRQIAYSEFRKLILEGVNESLAFVLIRDAFINLPHDADTIERLRLRLSRIISNMATVAPIEMDEGTRTSVFVGPTGVGKTTTIAKLAARFALKHRKQVKLLTIDTYRIGATEQLRAYGEIIGIPVKVIYSADELEREVRAASRDEILLVDTTGHSHKRVADYDELSSFLRDRPDITKHLVLSCTTRLEDLREISACFGVFAPDRLVFTKLDEASSFGVIFNETVRMGKPLSYLTNGQDVAEDLIFPTPTTLADLLVPMN